MKLINLAEQILKYAVTSYKNSLNEYIDFDSIKEYFNDQHEEYLIKAVGLLVNDGLVSAFDSDNTISFIYVLPEAIRNVEENTLLKKGYTILKEIKELLP
ncbi:MAG: lactate permease [Candidatus Ornithomonoglobus sp.]